MGCNEMSAIIRKVLLPFTSCQLSWTLCSPSSIWSHLLSAEVPEWSCFLVLISSWPSPFAMGLLAVLPLVSLCWTTCEETEKLSLSVRDFHLVQILPPISRFLPLLTSSLLVIPSPWTSGTGGKRRSWTLSLLTHLGHRSTSALTSRPSALTKPRLRSRLPAAVNCLRSHGTCLWTKCLLEGKPGCLYGGRHLFSETMSKYKSAQDTDQEYVKHEQNVCRKSYLLKYLHKSTQNSLETLF